MLSAKCSVRRLERYKIAQKGFVNYQYDLALINTSNSEC